MIFTCNATHGLNIAIRTLVRPGCRVAVSGYEHNAVTRVLHSIPGVEINSSWWDNLEIMAAGVHKGAALRCLAQRLEIPLDEVMAIGDNENDLPMLQVAGLPVAMGNAVESVKQQCAFVTATNDEDGVARAVRRFVLHEEQ